MDRIERPLDPDACVTADAAVAPESGERRLTMDDKDLDLRRTWARVYRETLARKSGTLPTDVAEEEDEAEEPKPIEQCPDPIYNFVVLVPGTTRPLNTDGGESNSSYWEGYRAFMPSFKRLVGVLLRNTVKECANTKNEKGSFQSFCWSG